MAEAKHEMHHMEIHPAENGGHTVMHHFKHKASKSGAFRETPEPEHHVFGPNEGHEMLAHVANHLGVKEMPAEEEPEVEEAEAGTN